MFYEILFRDYFKSGISKMNRFLHEQIQEANFFLLSINKRFQFIQKYLFQF